MVFATIGGRPVVLARPDQRHGSPDEPVDLTVPITMSRLRRAVDIERDRAAYPYVPSLVDDVPLGELSDSAKGNLVGLGIVSGGIAALVFRRNRLLAGVVAGVGVPLAFYGLVSYIVKNTKIQVQQ
jgi:hypothetical protein